MEHMTGWFLILAVVVAMIPTLLIINKFGTLFLATNSHARRVGDAVRAPVGALCAEKMVILKDTYSNLYEELPVADRTLIISLVKSLEDDYLSDSISAVTGTVFSRNSSYKLILVKMVQNAVLASSPDILITTVKYGDRIAEMYGIDLNKINGDLKTATPIESPRLLLSIVIILLSIVKYSEENK